MLHSARELSDLIGAIYAAGLDPTGARWPAVLGQLSAVIAGGGSVLLGVQRRRYASARVHYVGSDPESIALYQAYYGGMDPVFESRLPHAPPGRILLGDAIVPAGAPRRAALDADWSRPRDFGAGAAAVLVRHGSAEAGLYAVRPRARGAFPLEDLEVLELLLPHLTAAVQASLRLAALGDAREAVADALDRWDEAVLLVDGALRVHATNRAADALLAAGDGLAVEPARGPSGGQLRAATPSATAALRRRRRPGAPVREPRARPPVGPHRAGAAGRAAGPHARRVPGLGGADGRAPRDGRAVRQRPGRRGRPRHVARAPARDLRAHAGGGGDRGRDRGRRGAAGGRGGARRRAGDGAHAGTAGVPQDGRARPGRAGAAGDAAGARALTRSPDGGAPRRRQGSAFVTKPVSPLPASWRCAATASARAGQRPTRTRNGRASPLTRASIPRAASRAAIDSASARRS